MTQLEEYQAVRRQAGLIDCSAWGVVEVRGADRVAFLHNLLTQDIKTLASGAGCEAALVTPAAKLLADMVVFADADAHWLLALRRRVDTILKTLERYLITEDVALQDRTTTHAIVALQGPASQEMVKELPGRSARVVAYSITGSPGLLILMPADQSATLQADLVSRGVPRVGPEALNVLRLEAGIPWYGVDMDESNLLPETGLEARAVSQTKGCYVGQEVMARLAAHGSVSRKLMGLVCEGNDVPAAKDPILKDAERVGEITSACFSPALKRPIALGYVKRPCYEVGNRVLVQQAGREISATLVKLPFLSLGSG